MILDTIETLTKAMGALIFAGPDECPAQGPLMSYMNSALSSLTVKCNGSNPFTDIRSLNSVPAPATNQPMKGEPIIEYFWPSTGLWRQH